MVNRKELRQDEYSSLIYILIFAITAFGFLQFSSFGPVPAKEQNAPENEFSAERADLMIRRILPEQIPHPVGTKENFAVVERIVAQFGLLGYQAEIEPTYFSDSSGNFIGLNNILVRIPGSSGKQSVVIMGHHDSVPASPGYADGLNAVGSMLEMARALKTMPQMQQDILFLITDGEEFGLLGAKAFARDNKDFLPQISCILNMEARGTTGPSFMFESGQASGQFVKAFLDSSPKPIATSLFPAFYDLLPNDTDFSVFKRLNIQGLNFAFIDRLPLYHSPIDDINHLDLNTLQHQGESVFNALLAIASTEDLQPSEKLVFFDVVGMFTISWPTSWTIWIALSGLLLAIAAIFLCAAVRAVSLKQLVQGIMFVLAMIVIFAICGVGFAQLFKLISGESMYWYAYADYYSATFFIGLLGIGLIVASFIKKSFEPLAIMLATWLIVSALGVALAVVLPGSSYMFIAPAIFGAALALAAGLWRFLGQSAVIIASSIATIFAQTIYIPVIIGGLLGLGFSMSPLQSIPLVIIFLAALPLLLLLQQKQIKIAGSVLLVLSVVLLLGITLVPSYSANSPQPVNFNVFQNSSDNSASWTTAKNSFQQYLDFADDNSIAELEEKYDFIDSVIRLKRDGAEIVIGGSLAPITPAPEPSITMVSSYATADAVTYKLRIEPQSNFPYLQILFPPQKAPNRIILHHPILGDLALKNELSSKEGWTKYTIYTTPAAGMEITVDLPLLGDFEFTTLAMKYGLPDWADTLGKARKRNAAMPNGRGDKWYVINQHLFRHIEE